MIGPSRRDVEVAVIVVGVIALAWAVSVGLGSMGVNAYYRMKDVKASHERGHK